jgi:hypothetical protein
MSETDSSRLPWEDWPDVIGCSMAAGHLVRNLGEPLSADGQLDAPTFIAAAGAVAGWGAHRSLIAEANLHRQPVAAQIVTLEDGRTLLYGDDINNRLASNDAKTAPLMVWNNLAGTAISHGLPERGLPDLGELFRNVTQRIGTPNEGLPSIHAEYLPHAPAAQLLERVLPLTLSCLTGEISEIARKHGFKAEETSYQAVTAYAAAKILSQSCSILPPKIALIIGIESAIYASKLMAPFHPAMPTGSPPESERC